MSVLSGYVQRSVSDVIAAVYVGAVVEQDSSAGDVVLVGGVVQWPQTLRHATVRIGSGLE